MSKQNDDAEGCVGCIAILIILGVIGGVVTFVQDHPWISVLLALVLVSVTVISVKHFKRNAEAKRQSERQAAVETQRRHAQMLATEEQQRKEALRNTLKRTSLAREINAMSGVEFEAFIAEFLDSQGYSVQHTKVSGDQGVDLLVSLPERNRNIAVQLKRYSRPLGNKPVQEVFAGMTHYCVNEAWVITNTTFTPGAYALARSTNVKLIDGDELLEWMREGAENVEANYVERYLDKDQNHRQGSRRVSENLTLHKKNQSVVNLDSNRIESSRNLSSDSGMEKHLISVGSDHYGETVAFTANELGTASVNGGLEAGGIDFTVYRLPDGKYRALVKSGEISLLEPSNFTETFGTDQDAEYGRWTYEEAEMDETYGEMFRGFMAQHPTGKKQQVRDLD